MRRETNIWVIAILSLIVPALVACSGGPLESAEAVSEAPGSDTATQPAVAEEVDDPEVAATGKLSLNEATGDEFMNAIPGFSNRMVREFQEYRPYISLQQFRREIGKYVSDEQVAEYEQYVYVPVDVDESDAETLKQLPGVDEAVAADLIAGRPYGSNEVFLAKLAEYVSDAELATAETYLVAD